MAQNTAHIHFREQVKIAVPAFLILLGMPLTYSISDGLALGMITYEFVWFLQSVVKKLAQ